MRKFILVYADHSVLFNHDSLLQAAVSRRSISPGKLDGGSLSVLFSNKNGLRAKMTNYGAIVVS